jgi:hypothetical protein
MSLNFNFTLSPISIYSNSKLSLMLETMKWITFGNAFVIKGGTKTFCLGGKFCFKKNILEGKS